MKDKMFLFPALILVLTPCVWYSNQPGVDGIQGIDFLLSPGCFLATAIAVIGIAVAGCIVSAARMAKKA